MGAQDSEVSSAATERVIPEACFAMSAGLSDNVSSSMWISQVDFYRMGRQ
jgi:hypothetical protein